jgi:hypothetical protein
MEREEEGFFIKNIRIGELFLGLRSYPILAEFHETKERFYGRHEIVPLQMDEGERTFFHLRPYISFTPDFLGNQPIGNVYAWYYQNERLLVFWECRLFDWVREDDPLKDDLLREVWEGAEKVVRGRCVGVEKVATPASDPLYDTGLYQKFLEGRGFKPSDYKSAYIKHLTIEK